MSSFKADVDLSNVLPFKDGLAREDILSFTVGVDLSNALSFNADAGQNIPLHA